jgi:hypothetical protein
VFFKVFALGRRSIEMQFSLSASKACPREPRRTGHAAVILLTAIR